MSRPLRYASTATITAHNHTLCPGDGRTVTIRKGRSPAQATKALK